MKALVKLLTVCLLVSFIAGCGAPATPTPAATQPPATQPPTAQPPATEVPLTAAEQWAKTNGLGPYQPATEDWAAVEAAAILEGSVCVYSNSSKIAKLVDPWNALYPDIALDCGDTDDIAVKMQAEQEAGNVVGDVWFQSSGHILYGQFVPNQWIWSYVPEGVVEPELTAEQPFAVARHSIDVWGYNSEVDDACPFTNWWELTESKFTGKVYMEDPMTNVSDMAKWATVAQHGDEMAAAYQELYGVDWTTDPAAAVDPFTGEAPANAGWLFIKKLAQNKPGIEPGGDEVDAAYATLGMDPDVEPGVGWTGWDSVENTADGEGAMAPCLDVTPVFGMEKTSYLGVANMAPHPNAAKLFIKFVLSPEGMAPWSKIGVYSAQPSMPVPEGALPFDEMHAGTWATDPVYGWEWAAKVRDFWAISLLTPKPEE